MGQDGKYVNRVTVRTKDGLSTEHTRKAEKFLNFCLDRDRKKMLDNMLPGMKDFYLELERLLCE